jgi:hypothetical protein
MERLQTADIFKNSGYVHVKNLINKDLCYFLTHVLLRKYSEPNKHDDDQVPNCLATLDHEILFETLLEKVWPDIELVTGLDLLPTYAYSRLYTNGNLLERHSDREECEISVSLQLGRSHHYSWPIWMNGSRHDLAEGDAVIYRGYELDHWRERCDGPPDYYSGQVFLHFVNANGPWADRVGDNRIRQVYKNMFIKNRHIVMETK